MNTCTPFLSRDELVALHKICTEQMKSRGIEFDADCTQWFKDTNAVQLIYCKMPLIFDEGFRINVKNLRQTPALIQEFSSDIKTCLVAQLEAFNFLPEGENGTVSRESEKMNFKVILSNFALCVKLEHPQDSS
jgi:hypothetical protein